jgi:hypothetical protein
MRSVSNGNKLDVNIKRITSFNSSISEHIIYDNEMLVDGNSQNLSVSDCVNTISVHSNSHSNKQLFNTTIQNENKNNGSYDCNTFDESSLQYSISNNNIENKMIISEEYENEIPLDDNNDNYYDDDNFDTVDSIDNISNKQIVVHHNIIRTKEKLNAIPCSECHKKYRGEGKKQAYYTYSSIYN